jgi:hypothetical protein
MKVMALLWGKLSCVQVLVLHATVCRCWPCSKRCSMSVTKLSSTSCGCSPVKNSAKDSHSQQWALAAAASTASLACAHGYGSQILLHASATAAISLIIRLFFVTSCESVRAVGLEATTGTGPKGSRAVGGLVVPWAAPELTCCFLHNVFARNRSFDNVLGLCAYW